MEADEGAARQVHHQNVSGHDPDPGREGDALALVSDIGNSLVKVSVCVSFFNRQPFEYWSGKFVTDQT